MSKNFKSSTEGKALTLSTKVKRSKLSVHDKLFKTLLKLFRRLGLLKKFVSFIFTAIEQQTIKIKDLRIISGSSTGNGFNEVHADITITLSLIIANISKKLMVVLEHKSHQGKEDIEQLKNYCVRLSYDNKCPVIPVFFYHGKKAWKKPLFYGDQFEVLEGIPQTLLPFLKFFYRLLDVQSMDIYQIKDPLMRIVFFTFQRVWLLKQGEDAKLKVLKEFFEHAKEVQKQYKSKYNEIIKKLLAYFLEYEQTLTWDILEKIALKSGYYKEGGERMEYLKHTEEGAREIGRQEGRREGKQEGQREGRQEGKQSVILNMLKDGMNIQAITKYTGFSKKQVLELQKQAGL